MGKDQRMGVAVLTIGGLVFLYYTVWMIFTPFIDADHPVQEWFPDRYYAVAIPAFAGVVVLTVISTFTSLVMIKGSAP